MTKLLCLAIALSLTGATTTIALADAPPPTGAPAAPAKMWSKITVSSIKPTLTARNVFVIKGTHNNGVRGGWTLETPYVINKETSVIQITLAASAPAGSVATKDLAPIEAKVEIKELANNAVGHYDIVVVDHDGKELARTVYDRK